ncbi:tripartite motif-containing protein 2-like [Branchiostoma lanceolatum]|uniref:tripartite motif-containing protein 2-like n=1 Tax=Branchiostoma lanceolatum TaxID=7740 RepID=UPI00345631A4
MADSGSGKGEKPRAILHCGICLEPFNNPKALACLHTFCQDCLVNLVGKKTYLTCPTCRSSVSLPPKGVQGLPDNFWLSELSTSPTRRSSALYWEHLNKSASSKSADGTERDSGISEGDSTSPNGTLMENDLRPVGTRSKTKARTKLTCGKNIHIDEDVRFFCEQCEETVCEGCLKKHGGHSVCNMEEAQEMRTCEMQSLLGMLTSQVNDLNRGTKKLRDQQKQLQDERGRVESQIRRTAGQWWDAVKLCEEELLKELDRAYEGLRGPLADQQERAEGVSTDITAMVGQSRGKLKDAGVIEKLTTVRKLGEAHDRVLGAVNEMNSFSAQRIKFSPSMVPGGLGQIVVENKGVPEDKVDKKVTRSSNRSRSTSGPKIDQELLATSPNNVPSPTLPSEESDVEEKLLVRAKVTTIGGNESSEGRIDEPTGVAVSDDGFIFVSDWAKQRVRVYDEDGRFQRNILVEEKSSIVRPARMAFDSYRRQLYVSCTSSSAAVGAKKTVKAYMENGDHLFDVSSGLHCPHDLAVCPKTGRVVILDTELRTLLTVSSSGRRVRSFSCYRDVTAPPPVCLNSVAIDGNGDIVLADWWYNNVKILKPSGEVQLTFGTPGWEEGHLNRPAGVCVEPAGNIVVADGKNGRVQRFDPAGARGEELLHGLQAPSCVACARDGRVVVLDEGRKAVLLVEYQEK